mmetsp:Transcript_12297/g.37514  ORF Transcript_12297/g.37514 Transcript_12297/m.37514 type:complete len:496 (-) Transcript_12297:31-1518(-)
MEITSAFVAVKVLTDDVRLKSSPQSMCPRTGAKVARRSRVCAVAKDVPTPTPPFRWSLPYVGTIVDTVNIMMDVEGFFDRNLAKYGPMFHFRTGGRDVYVCSGQENAQIFFKEMASKLTTKDSLSPTTTDMLGPRALNLLDGEEHRHVRKIVSPPFNKKSVSLLFEKMNQITAEFCEDLSRMEGEFQLAPKINRMTFDVLMKCILGIKDDRQIDEFIPLFSDLKAGLTSVKLPLLNSRYHRGVEARKKLVHKINDIVAQKRKILETLENEADAATDPLMLLLLSRDENGNQLTGDDIATQVLLLMFAGHDTTATAITRCVQELLSPENSQVLDELYRTVESCEGGLTSSALSKMPYLNMVIYETYRRWPSAPVLFRQVLTDFTFNNYFISKGSFLGLSISATNRDPSRYQEPLSFRPDRFAGVDLGSTNILPTFGGSYKLCLGKHFADAEFASFLLEFVRLVKRHGMELVAQQNLEKKRWSASDTPRSGLLVRLK